MASTFSFNSLNSAQRQAVAALDGPVMILAGAGTGKTRTVTCRIAHMLEKKIPAPEILAVTFTNKAASEMRERIAGMVTKKAASDMTVCTFHSLCVRLLRGGIDKLGIPPDLAINRALGVQPKFFATNAKNDNPPAREKIIRSCLRNNYQNFLMLGYKADLQTLERMKQGDLPPIPSGPQSDRKPEIALLIPSAISPGMEKVIANLIIRPPQPAGQPASAIEIATAKQLACDLADARLIEEPVRDQILKELSKPLP